MLFLTMRKVLSWFKLLKKKTNKMELTVITEVVWTKKNKTKRINVINRD